MKERYHILWVFQTWPLCLFSEVCSSPFNPYSALSVLNSCTPEGQSGQGWQGVWNALSLCLHQEPNWWGSMEYILPSTELVSGSKLVLRLDCITGSYGVTLSRAHWPDFFWSIGQVCRNPKVQAQALLNRSALWGRTQRCIYFCWLCCPG